MDRPLTPADFWAKLDQDEDGHVTDWHPLAAHSAEVAAVTETLLTRTILRDRLTRLIGWEELSDVHVARLAALAAIHDAGKVNHGFQNIGFDGAQPRNGHVGPLIELLFSFSKASGRWIELLAQPVVPWFSRQEDLEDILLATFGHHGRPVLPEGDSRASLWEEDEQRAPFEAAARLVERIRTWYPDAFAEDAPPFPHAPSFQHAFNGVLTLADWIGSDRRFFDFVPADDPTRNVDDGGAARAVRRLFLDPQAPRETLGDAPIGFSDVLPKNEEGEPNEPYDIQKEVLDLPLHAGKGSLTVLESDTGSGKTEAALARFLRLYQQGLVDGMYFAVPTRSAATQLHGRIKRIKDRVFAALPKDERPSVVQAVPGYIKADDAEATRLPDFEVAWSKEDEAMRYRGWAAEHPKRYFAGPIVVGTVDQALLSTLKVSHAHLRGAALLRHFLVVDEVHASSVYMTALLKRVLDHHLDAGGHAFLMSATLGAEARVRYTTAGRSSGELPRAREAEQKPYPLLTHVSAARSDPQEEHAASSGRQKEVLAEARPIAGDPKQVAALASEKARAGARVLVIRNLVNDCHATQRALEDELADAPHLLFGIKDGDAGEGRTPAPHHSRFAPADRARLDARIEEVFGKDSPPPHEGPGVVAVATQTVEQSLDISSSILLTDLCPMDVLLQRLGRLHRHGRRHTDGFQAARCVVLTPEERDLGTFIRGKEASGPHGLTDVVYGDLRMIEATWRLLEEGEDAGVRWRIPADNRRLVERATHPECLRAIAGPDGKGDSGDAWTQHQEHIRGVRLGDDDASRQLSIDRTEPFRDCRFDPDAAPKTRLGVDDYRVELADPQPGPFGEEINVLTVAAWHFDETPDAVENGDAVTQDVMAFDGGFTFSFGGEHFRYDRQGLGVQDR